MINNVTVEGYVCGRIDTRATKAGREVTSFTLNSPKRRKVDGSWESVPRFIRCTYWHSEQNDFRAPQITDKARLVVSGEIDYEEWQASDGSKRSETRVTVRELVTVAPRDSGASQGARAAQEDAYQTDLYDENIPF